MKLRNKKTGEIGEPRVAYQEIYVDTTGQKTYCYKTIAELNEEWEDYKPAEPLIKDEKIRKAVRAWAEANSLTYVQYKSGDLGDRFNGYDFEYICFNPWKADNLKEYCDYTITELCGSEEC